MTVRISLWPLLTSHSDHTVAEDHPYAALYITQHMPCSIWPNLSTTKKTGWLNVFSWPDRQLRPAVGKCREPVRTGKGPSSLLALWMNCECQRCVGWGRDTCTDHSRAVVTRFQLYWGTVLPVQRHKLGDWAPAQGRTEVMVWTSWKVKRSVNIWSTTVID